MAMSQPAISSFMSNVVLQPLRSANAYLIAGRPVLLQDKLFFILIYLKTNPLQELHTIQFGMTQPQVNKWLHLLSGILRCTLKTMGELPDRSSKRLIYILKSCTNSSALPEINMIWDWTAGLFGSTACGKQSELGERYWCVHKTTEKHFPHLYDNQRRIRKDILYKNRFINPTWKHASSASSKHWTWCKLYLNMNLRTQYDLSNNKLHSPLRVQPKCAPITLSEHPLETNHRYAQYHYLMNIYQ